MWERVPATHSHAEPFETGADGRALSRSSLVGHARQTLLASDLKPQCAAVPQSVAVPHYRGANSGVMPDNDQ
eukprot:5259392-Amphidinium_carterae.1